MCTCYLLVQTGALKHTTEALKLWSGFEPSALDVHKVVIVFTIYNKTFCSKFPYLFICPNSLTEISLSIVHLLRLVLQMRVEL